MIAVSVIAVLVLLASIFGGLRQGAVRQLFNLLATLIAIPVAGFSYHLLADVLSFIPGTNWENFIAFFIMLAVTNIVLFFVFLLPARALKKAWAGGLYFCVLGAIFSLVNTILGIVVFALVLHAYPIFSGLEHAVSGSSVVSGLVSVFGFIQVALPEVFRQAAAMVYYFLA
jgi:uncharacterized membrane protein required for colicin V production